MRIGPLSMPRDDFAGGNARQNDGGNGGPCAPGWQEMVSKVHCPGRGLLLAVGTCFLVIGTIGFFTIEGVVPPKMPAWIAPLGAAVFASLGGIVTVFAVASILRPVRVRHADASVLPNVSNEPVIQEGSVVHGRMTHELVEDSDGWQLRPSQQLRHYDTRLLIGFGVPFLVLFSGILSWVFHREGIFTGWPLCVLFGTAASAITGGSALLLNFMLTRASHRRLCRLTISKKRGDLELDTPREPNLESAELNAGLKWLFVGETERQQLTIPLELVAAVQLCPWKHKIGSGTTWAVQGLLVLASPEWDAYQRIPLLLTSDFVDAARLMQRLAEIFNVPYLFSGDASGWHAEEARAKKRRPLQVGGHQS